MPELPRWIWVKTVLCLGMAAGLLLSPRLWLSGRSYPLSPVADWLTPIPSPWDAAGYASLVALLTAMLLLPRPRWIIWIFFAFAGLMPLWDQSRLQPWFYQYLFMFGALAAAATPRADDPAAQNRLLNPCRLIIACIYVYSGLQKCSAAFMSEAAPWLLKPTTDHAPQWLADFLLHTRYAFPAIEILIGIGLLIRPLRVPAIVAAMLMHIGILWTLGPWGHDWNSVVWPWNLAMMTLVPLLFLRTRQIRISAVLWDRSWQPFPKLVLLLFAVMPLLSFFGWWDLYLSAALYSGNTPAARLEFDQAVYESLPADVKQQCWPAGDERYELHLTSWSMAELNVPDYPAERVQLHVAETMSRRFPQTEFVLTMIGRPRIWTGDRVTTQHILGPHRRDIQD